MPGDVFVDTNILVYAYDTAAGSKHEAAKRLVAELWHTDPWPAISVQVLQELFVNLHRLGVPLADVRARVQDFAQWHVVENTVALVEEGIAEVERWQVSFWDGLILAAARRAGVATVWSEDLNDGQAYDGLRVTNPLK